MSTILCLRRSWNDGRSFQGDEGIEQPHLGVFSFIKRLTPNIVQFYKLPYNKLHGVVTRVEL